MSNEVNFEGHLRSGGLDSKRRLCRIPMRVRGKGQKTFGKKPVLSIKQRKMAKINCFTYKTASSH